MVILKEGSNMELFSSFTMLLFFLSSIIFFLTDSELYFVGGTNTSASKSTNGSQRSFQQHSNYQTPASALYEASESSSGLPTSSAGKTGNIPCYFLHWFRFK